MKIQWPLVIVFIIIAWWIFFRKKKKSDEKPQTAALNTPANNLVSSIATSAKTQGVIAEIANIGKVGDDSDQLDIIDDQAIAQNAFCEGEFIERTRPQSEKILGSSSADITTATVKKPDLKRDQQWWPLEMYTTIPVWNQCGCGSECGCGE